MLLEYRLLKPGRTVIKIGSERDFERLKAFFDAGKFEEEKNPNGIFYPLYFDRDEDKIVLQEMDRKLALLQNYKKNS